MFTTLNDNVEEASKWTLRGSMYLFRTISRRMIKLGRTQHALASDNDLLRLFLDWQRTDQSSNFFSSLPFRELSKTLLTHPDTSVNDLQKQLTRPQVEYEDGTI